MEITEVKVHAVNEEKLKAFVSIVFDRCFMVNDVKVIQGREGLFVSMPSRRKRNGDFKDVAHPLNHETRRWLEERVLDEYRRNATAKDPVAGEDHFGPAEMAPGDHAPSSPERRERSTTATELDRLEEIHLGDSFWRMDP